MREPSDILIVPPEIEPLSRAQAKLHLRATSDTEDALVDSIIAGARDHAETFTRRALVMQTRRLLLDRFPAKIEILRAPVRSVLSVKYLDRDGDLQTVDAETYRVDRDDVPAVVSLEPSESWPDTYEVPNAVQITYTAGYLIPFTADADTEVLTAAGHGFEDGDVTRVATIGGALPTGLAADTNYHVRDADAGTLKLAATSGGSAIDITAAGTAPNVLGVMDRTIEQALQLLIQYFEQRDANAAYKSAAEALLGPYRIVRL